VPEDTADHGLAGFARRRVAQAQRDGQPIPNDWAIGIDGEPTTDPAVALLGAMRPVAGHKGIGLAMIVECLAGCLGGMAHEAPRAHDSAGSASGVSELLLQRHHTTSHKNARLTYLRRIEMVQDITHLRLTPGISIVAGALTLIVPELLNVIVAVYLICIVLSSTQS
jgi:LDH2 family malate/lactate/ureidoglycolate dehydrogenase